ncbi:unnamed protein product [Rotaria magnacalcarata]
MCQYKFSHNFFSSFGDIVGTTFKIRDDRNFSMTSGTCYRFVANCNRELWPLCLDWQTTECSDYDEYRCHYGGQCIPRAFKRDNHYSSDCLDGNDEKEHYSQYTRTYNIQCKMISTFSCEERISRLTRSFQCGNSVHLSETILPNYSFYCDNQRDKEISRMLLPSFEHISEVNCRQAFYCVLHYKRNYGFDSPWLATDMSLIVFEGIWNKECEPLTKHCSSEWLVIPEKPIMFRMFQFVYLTNRFFSEFEGNIVPDFIFMELTDYFVGFTLPCRTTNTNRSCNNASYFHCNQSSRCISYDRVGDGIVDCFYGEDELFDTCQWKDSNRFKCKSERTKCLSPVAVGNGFSECLTSEDEIFVYITDLVELIPFMDLCNTKSNLNLILLGINETDETNCEWWPCNNSYTHCNGVWDCPNGADELNCSETVCSSNEHECKNEQLDLSYCLPIVNMFDKYIY